MSVSYDVIIVGVVCGVVAASVLVAIIWRYCTRKRKRQSSYEQILPDRKQSIHIENGTLVVNMKQIPFTVPTQTTLSRRIERGSSEEFRPPGGGGLSEPTSPLNVKRPSVEIPGAYALGSIDPSLYKIVDEDDDYEIPMDHIGRVWFAVEYERETEKLLVTLMKAKNLPTRQYGNNSSCDPFIRLYLMPDERRYLQSKFKKKTCNPKFEESFVFQVSYRSLQDRVLKITVYDVDRHRRHNVVGHALYPLKDHDAESNERLVMWRDLEREVTETTADKGELLVALCYNNHLERLTVGVLEARDLKYDNQPSDTYVKVCVLVQNKVVKTKKTEVHKKTDTPNYNESFTFKLPVTSLDSASLSLTIMQHSSGHKDKIIGRVILGSFMFARGKELDHWNEMVANQRDQVTQWHGLV
uniref:Synaptotagmin-15-like isoform X2 n=1 Tax=Crassostrea virginica TaxID=6565 RepID=A0A8B8CVF6_CRAVI|nr:synaptotagmin-15-like isoform X2 [Crassostrea virginica]XP_022319655.1 synaptotagmin-15-like isoform X2 [Crassostrea virginica]